MTKSNAIQVIALTSGKGGVGKTNAALNLSVSLQRNNYKVLLLDADLGLANVDVMVGLHSDFNLSHVLSGQKDINEILIEGPEGVYIVPASSGIQKMSDLSELEISNLISAFNQLENNYDYLIIDTAAGLSSGVMSFLQAAHQVVVVAVDEPTSITDAYAMIKVLKQDYNVNNIWLLSNMVDDFSHGDRLYKKIDNVATRFLGNGINHLGSIPLDGHVKKANKCQQVVMSFAPTSMASVGYQRAAEKLLKIPPAIKLRGHMEFFVERMVNRASL